jgi:hypothetical protein
LCVYIAKKNREFCPIQRSITCFYNETASVYCTVRVGAVNTTKYLSTLKGFSCVGTNNFILSS